MTIATTNTAAQLRRRMVDELTRSGALRTPEWREAFDAVPRELFVPNFTVRSGSQLTPYRKGDPGYLEAVYSDASLNTLYDEHGIAISSSSQPRVMAAMAEALAPSSETLPVLDLGTGPGYNAALLSHRYGSEHVVSRDIDHALIEAAEAHLRAAGYTPTLTTGNGARGCPEHAPYGALIATYGTGRIPDAWRSQVVPGGNIVANLGNGLVALTVAENGSAAGRFLPTLAAFMSARTTADNAPAPASAHAGKLAHAVGTTREIELPAALDEHMPRFLSSLLQPGVVELTLIIEGQQVYGLIHPESGSWARIIPGTDGTARLTFDGPRDLWTERAPVLAEWTAAGQPPPDAYLLTIHADGSHELNLGDHTWLLPN